MKFYTTEKTNKFLQGFDKEALLLPFVQPKHELCKSERAHESSKMHTFSMFSHLLLFAICIPYYIILFNI